jgi:hypothetical protein
VPYQPPSSSDLRASDADRESAVERLRVAGMEGRLDSDELEQRIESAYAARWCSELDALTLDVTPPPARLAQPPVFVRPARKLNGLSIASLVAAVCFFWMWGVGSLAAVIMGHAALRQIARSGGTQTGRPAALTGVALGYIELAGVLLVLLLMV